MLMPPSISDARRLAAALAWLAGSALGWALLVSALWQQPLYTYRDLILALPVWLVFGALAGAATGLGQALAGRLLGQPARPWLWASITGYGLALPAGLLAGALLLLLFGSRSGLVLPWSQPGSLSYSPFPANPIYAGFVVGLCQWPVLRLRRPTPAMRLLWICGVWLGIGLGLFAGGALATFLFHGLSSAQFALAWGAGWGLTIGLVSAGVLWVLRRAQAPASQPGSAALNDDGPARFRAAGRS
jgi:hypothetical protein